MKTTTLGIASLVMISVVLAGCTTKPTSTAFQTPPAQQAPQANQQILVASNGYVPYNASEVTTALDEQKNVIVFFHSKSCPSCAKLNQDIEANIDTIPEDVLIFKADRDEHQDLAAQYNVANYHTLSYLSPDGGVTNVRGIFELTEVLEQLEEARQAPQDNQANDSMPTEDNSLSPYTDYSPEAYAQARAEGKKIALNFSAPRCPNCKRLDAELSNTEIPNDSVVFKTDYDTETELKQQYNVTQQTTVIILDDQGTFKEKLTLPTVEEILVALQ